MLNKDNIQNAIYKSNTDCLIKISSFFSSVGSSEFFISIEPISYLPFETALSQLESSYLSVLKEHDIPVDSCVFCRIFLSDIENQKQKLYLSSFYGLFSNVSTSVIGEASANYGPICILIYHIKNTVSLIKKITCKNNIDQWKRDVLISGMNYSLLWNTNYCVNNYKKPYDQTEKIFYEINDSIKKNKMSFLNNSIRSWIFIRDIDNHYLGMVEARKNFFAHEKLNITSRYLASTGIEGQSPNINSLISVDMLSIRNVRPEQIVRMKALDAMPPTIDYGVTFERGLRINFGDRSHLYISGTASINNAGEVIHIGDAQKQTSLALKNIDSLLRNQGASLDDLAYLIIYIRDFSSTLAVRDAVFKHIPKEIPMIIVRASVCRPSWLVEVEGFAILPTEAIFPPFL